MPKRNVDLKALQAKVADIRKTLSESDKPMPELEAIAEDLEQQIAECIAEGDDDTGEDTVGTTDTMDGRATNNPITTGRATRGGEVQLKRERRKEADSEPRKVNGQFK